MENENLTYNELLEMEYNLRNNRLSSNEMSKINRFLYCSPNYLLNKVMEYGFPTFDCVAFELSKPSKERSCNFGFVIGHIQGAINYLKNWLQN